MRSIKAWAIYDKKGFWVDLKYERIKRNWDSWFKRDGRWMFSEIEIIVKNSVESK